MRYTSDFRFIKTIAVCQEPVILNKTPAVCHELNGLEKYIIYGYAYFSKWKYFCRCESSYTCFKVSLILANSGETVDLSSLRLLMTSFKFS